MGDLANLLYGKATLEISYNAGGSWTTMPFQSEDGVKWGYTPNFNEEFVQEHDAPVLLLRDKEAGSVTVTVKETNADQLKHAIAGVINSTPGTVEVGDQAAAEVALRITGMGPSGTTQVATFYRCVSNSGVEIAYVKAKVRILAITYTLMCDTTKDAETEGTMFKVVEA